MISIVGYPQCAKCNKPVDHVANDQDVIFDEILIIAFCHGERETVRVTTEMLFDAESNISIGGLAFAPKTLTEGE